MKKPELVVMAAGMGSRYGGLKQIDSVDEYGHIIIDYSIHDAIEAGFETVTFIIKKAIEEDFRRVMDKHLQGKPIKVKYVYQELDKLPEGYSVPEGRVKPWGTAHAISCCLGIVDAPFAVINADDYYGKEGFKKIYEFLSSGEDGEKYRYAMVGYRIKNTVTEKGTVSRGLCKSDENSMLTEVIERSNIGTKDGRIYYVDNGNEVTVDPETLVSMNFWGFTESYVKECSDRLKAFLDSEIGKNPEKCEFYLPTVVSQLIVEGKAAVKVLDNKDKWYGVTYKEDKADVSEALGMLIANGIYPSDF